MLPSCMTNTGPFPFQIQVPADILTDFDNSNWNAGTNLAYLKELVAYWRET